MHYLLQAKLSYVVVTSVLVSKTYFQFLLFTRTQHKFKVMGPHSTQVLSKSTEKKYMKQSLKETGYSLPTGFFL